MDLPGACVSYRFLYREGPPKLQLSAANKEAIPWSIRPDTRSLLRLGFAAFGLLSFLLAGRDSIELEQSKKPNAKGDGYRIPLNFGIAKGGSETGRKARALLRLLGERTTAGSVLAGSGRSQYEMSLEEREWWSAEGPIQDPDMSGERRHYFTDGMQSPRVRFDSYPKGPQGGGEENIKQVQSGLELLYGSRMARGGW